MSLKRTEVAPRKVHVYCYKCPEDVWERLSAHARARNLPCTIVLNEAINQYLRKQEKAK